MKKRYIYILIILLLITGCKKNPRNYMKVKWKLDDNLKPTVNFERSKDNNSYGIFYIDSQMKFEDFDNYIKKLEENGFKVNWKYSDIKSIKDLEESYNNKSDEDNIFSDGYVNFEMCNDKMCFFMQWANKEVYNSINKDKATSYSFKLEPEDINNKENNKTNEESNK